MRSITIPEAGKTRQFSNIPKGLSLLVIQAPPVDNIFEDAATFSFENQGIDYPATTGTRVPFGDCVFREIRITGTEATAGQELIVTSIPVCVDPVINLGDETREAQSGNTFVLDWTGDSNTVKQISEIDITNEDGRLAQSVYVQCRNADLIYRSNDGSGTDPDFDNENDSLLMGSDTGETEEIKGIKFILDARFINRVEDEEPKLVVWPRY